MTIEFKLPEVSEGVEAADIAEIVVSEGDRIEAGQVVMEVETDKAVAEIECPHAGVISKIFVSEGDSVPIGSPLLVISSDGGAGDTPAKEDRATEEKPAEKGPTEEKQEPSLAEKKTVPTPTESKPVATTSAPAAKTPLDSDAPYDDGKVPVPAGPSTRRMARELGVNLEKVTGSGPGGRITGDDVQAYVRALTRQEPRTAVISSMAAPQLPDFTKWGPVERRAMNRIAKTSAANLSYAWQSIPHVTQHDLADITDLESARRRFTQTIGKDGPKVTMTAIIIKSVTAVLKDMPIFNSSLDMGSGELILKQYYNIGVAVDTPNGLLVPVVHDADRKSIREIAADLTDIAGRARERRLSMDEMTGATFTITNLGGIGGTSFTPIINPPEVAILGLSRSQKQLELVDGEVKERLKLPLSLSYDHRVVNGADAARFIVKLSQSLSDWIQLLVAM